MWSRRRGGCLDVSPHCARSRTRAEPFAPRPVLVDFGPTTLPPDVIPGGAMTDLPR
jgi:hypothetical protein